MLKTGLQPTKPRAIVTPNMSPADILKGIRSLLTPVYGVRLRGVVLYGSEARGEAGPGSDIDVLVLLDHVADYGRDLRTNIETLYPLARQLGRRISAKPVSVRQYEDGDCPLYRNVRLEGIAA